MVLLLLMQYHHLLHFRASVVTAATIYPSLHLHHCWLMLLVQEQEQRELAVVLAVARVPFVTAVEASYQH